MSQKKKFIIVQSEEVANKLMAYGFRVLSNINGVYTFLNENKGNFNFDNVDKGKIAFSDRINI
jgi:hypothetical protein